MSFNYYMTYAILCGLLVVIVFAPIAVGSVYITVYSALEFVVFGLLLLHVWSGSTGSVTFRNTVPASRISAKRNSQEQLEVITGSYMNRTFLLLLPMLAFLGVVLFQFIPLPFDLLMTLSPATADMYMKLGSSLHSHPITLSIYSSTAQFLKWCAYAGIFFIIATFRAEKEKIRKGRWILILFAAIFIVAFIEAVYGLYAGLNRLESLLWFKRSVNIGTAAGTWINSDHLAGFLNMAIMCSAGLLMLYTGIYKTNRGTGRKGMFHLLSSGKPLFLWILIVGLIIMMLAVIFSLSRTGHISMLAGLAFMAIIYSAKKMNAFSLVLIIIACLSVLWGAWKGLEPVISKWSHIENALYGGRLEIWKGAIAMARMFPAFGTGLGTFELAYPPYKSDKFGSVLYEHAHNDYLEILSETGYAGLFLWMAFFMIFLYSATRMWFKRRDPIARGLGAGGIAATLTMMIHAISDFNFQIPSNAITLFIIMGLTWRSLHTSFSG